MKIDINNENIMDYYDLYRRSVLLQMFEIAHSLKFEIHPFK